MAQRSITDIVDSLEEYIKDNVNLNGLLEGELLEYCQELKQKAHDIAVDLTN